MSHTPVGGHPQGWEHKLADRSSLPPVPGEEKSKCANQADYAISPQHRYHGWKGSSAMGGREEASGWDGPDGSSVELQSPYGDQLLHGLAPGVGGEGKPAYLRWARTLHDLLEDAEGIKLFQNFVRNAGGLHSDRLDFYFAVQGLRQESQQPKIRQMVSAIYKFLRKSQLTMPEDLRQKVKQWFKDGTNIEPNIFDAMCAEVEKVMMETTYPNFLRSDAYIQYVSAAGHQAVSSGSLSSSSSPCSSTKDLCISNMPSALATLHEGEELTTGASPGPAAPLTPQRLTKDLLMATQKRRLQPETFSSGPFGRKYSVYSHPHLSYAAYCPTSRQDSEIQSLSSGRADSDAVSMSGSSVDGISRGKSEMSRERGHHSRRPRGLHSNAVINNDPDFEMVIPRTLRIPKEQMSMMKPEQFAPLLIEKLLKVRREQENQEKLERKLNEGEIDEGAKQAIPPQMVAAAIREKLQLEDDNDQDILDQHVSRVWSDRTPAPRSPPRSPPRRPRDLLSTLSADSGLYDAASLSTDAQQPLFRHTIGRRSLSKKTLTDSGVSVVSEGPPAPRVAAPPVESRILAWMQDGVHSAERYPRRSYFDSRASSAERSGGSRREPAQPFAADPQMPPPPRPHTPTQLDEARRRLALDYHPPRHHTKTSSKTSGGQWVAKETVVMFTFLDEQMPYRTRIPAAPVTLKLFKDYLPRKGNYRYFFKTECEELGNKVIQEEISNDLDLLPLFEGKVMARVKNIE